MFCNALQSVLHAAKRHCCSHSNATPHVSLFHQPVYHGVQGLLPSKHGTVSDQAWKCSVLLLRSHEMQDCTHDAYWCSPVIQVSMGGSQRRVQGSCSCLLAALTACSTVAGARMEDKCKECVGTGVVPCDLCGGTGLWRALSRKRANSTYEFVECPQCQSRGVKVCGVCFGSGLRNVRGLLRRPEATGLVLRMQHGELRPGRLISSDGHCNCRC